MHHEKIEKTLEVELALMGETIPFVSLIPKIQEERQRLITELEEHLKKPRMEITVSNDFTDGHLAYFEHLEEGYLEKELLNAGVEENKDFMSEYIEGMKNQFCSTVSFVQKCNRRISPLVVCRGYLNENGICSLCEASGRCVEPVHLETENFKKCPDCSGFIFSESGFVYCSNCKVLMRSETGEKIIDDVIYHNYHFEEFRKFSNVEYSNKPQYTTNLFKPIDQNKINEIFVKVFPEKSFSKKRIERYFRNSLHGWVMGAFTWDLPVKSHNPIVFMIYFPSSVKP